MGYIDCLFQTIRPPPRSELGPIILVDVEFTEEVLVEAEVLEEEVLVHSLSQMWVIICCSSIVQISITNAEFYP